MMGQGQYMVKVIKKEQLPKYHYFLHPQTPQGGLKNVENFVVSMGRKILNDSWILAPLGGLGVKPGGLGVKQHWLVWAGALLIC
jgi:hypothetical protein